MGSKLLEYFKNDELPASVWKGKYKEDGEETPDDMHRRMAKEFAKVEESYRTPPCNHDDDDIALSKYGTERQFLTEEKIYNFFKDFKYIIPQGSIMSQLGVKSIGSLSNCFVVGQPYDSYGGIFQKDQQLAQLMKRRGGVGIDISTLRPEGTNTSNAAKSSTGTISFMHRYSNTTREVAQNGRRGALMISIDINHPDVEEFAKIKRDLTQVTGANISIKLNKEFMEAVEKDEDYILRFPCDTVIPQQDWDIIYPEYGELYPMMSGDNRHEDFKVYHKRIKAREYWDEIIKSAHNVAEPGLMFWDNMVDYSPDGVYPQFKQITTNPCSEIGMQPYDACRLIAVNLFSFVDNPFTKDAKFNLDKFYQINYEAMRLSDDLIDLEIEHIYRILNKIEEDPEPEEIKRAERDLWLEVLNTAQASRRTGLGFTALGDALAALNIKYDSDEGLSIIETIMKVKMESELDCTTDMAITRGIFKGWDNSIEFKQHEKGIEGGNDFYNFILDTFPTQAARMISYGRRNVSWSTVAPTGSLSIMAKAITHSNVTSGLEPIFMPYYMRRKKVNPSDKGARVDFTDQNGDTWQEYAVVMGAFKDWYIIAAQSEHCPHIAIEALERASAEDMQKIYEESPWFGSTANDIDWVRRVEIQGVIQKYISHSISSTINLPSTVSEEEVSEIYLESWKKGLKGITVYRDGSRSGVLVSNDSTNNSAFEYIDAVKRPKELDAEVHHSTTKDVAYKVIVGLMDNKPYEIFIDDSEERFNGSGIVYKKSKGNYFFKQDDLSVDITSHMSEEQEAITRLVSGMLRHGANIKYVVEQLRKVDGDMFSFSKSLARVLKKYIPDGESSTVSCDECGSENVIFQEGCSTCMDCGSSACS